MGGPKIELDKALWARVQEHVLAAGYSSAGKIQGIGYIDTGLDI